MGRRAYYFGLLGLMLVGCASVKVTDRRELGAIGPTPPSIIYVADYGLDAKRLSFETGVLPIASISQSGADGSSTIFPRLFGVPIDRGVRARELAELMANSIVEDLHNLGLTAYRLRAGDKPPAAGWVVRGVFVRVDEGDRLRRALVGFGSGRTDLEVITSLSDLEHGQPQPFCELATKARSRRQPGAILSFDPYVAAERYMLCGLDLDANVMESAARIATAIARSVHKRDCAD